MKQTIIAVFIITLAITSSWSQGCDSTIVLSGGTSTSPFNPKALNEHFAILNATKCRETIEITLTLPNDTFYVDSQIFIMNADDLPFTLRFNLRDSKKAVLARTGVDPGIITISGPKVTLTQVGFVNRQTGNNPSLLITGDSATVTDCYFELQNVNSRAIHIDNSNATIQKCMFRYPGISLADPDRPNAIILKQAMANTIIRACLFKSAGLTLNSDGFSLIANTFAGRLGASANWVEISDDATSLQFNIANNLFAPDSYTRAPIFISERSAGANDKIQENAYAAQLSGIVPASYAGPLSKNVKLPPGLSNYSDKDYPLVQMRYDPSLNPNHDQFGIIPFVYRAFAKDVITPIGTGYTPSFQALDTVNWDKDVRVGCFGTFGEDVYHPSPLKSFDYKADSIRILKVSKVYDTDYYVQLQRTSCATFLFADNPDSLQGRELNTIKARGGVYTNDDCYFADGRNKDGVSDSTLEVPIELRTGDTIWVRQVDKNDSGFAPETQIAIDSVIGVARYPVSDFTMKLTSDEAAHSNGTVQFQFLPGEEKIAQIKVEAIRKISGLPDNIVETMEVDMTGSSQSREFTDLPVGDFIFRATPIGLNDSIGNNPISTEPMKIKFNTSSTLYVMPTKNCSQASPGSGTESSPFCNLHYAVNKHKDTENIKFIIGIANSNPDTISDPFKNALETSNKITLVSKAYFSTEQKQKTGERPVLRNVIFPRPDLAVKGFIIEHSTDNSAATIKANRSVLESNLIRSKSNNLLDIKATSLSDTVRIENNMFAGAFKLINIHSDVTIKITNNTFVGTAGTAFGVAMQESIEKGVQGSLTNNFFTGVNGEFPEEFLIYKTPQSFRVFRNVYAINAPDSQFSEGISRLTPHLPPVKYDTKWGENINFYSDSKEIMNKIKQVFRDFLVCRGNDCSPLFAGSDITTETLKDLFGFEKNGIREVGAIENFGSSGLYSFFSSTSANVVKKNGLNIADSISYSFTSLNFDPEENKYVHVWWIDKKLAAKDPLDVSEAIGHDVYEIDAPGGSSGFSRFKIVPTQKNIGLIDYTVFFAFGKTAEKPNELKWAENVYVPLTAGKDNCVIPEDSKCPPGGFWNASLPGGDVQIRGIFEKEVTGNLSVSGKVIPLEEKELVANISAGAIAPDNNTPYFEVQTSYDTQGEDDLENFYTIQSVFKSKIPDFTGLSLYKIDRDSTLYYWPYWSLDTTQKRLEIRLRDQGVFRLFFGKILKNPTKVKMEPVNLTYNNAQKNKTLSLAKGAAFLTGNPLVIITAIPAGSMMGKRPFAEDYFTRTHFFSNDLVDIGPGILKWRRNILIKQILELIKTDSLTKDDAMGKIPIDFTDVEFNSDNYLGQEFKKDHNFPIKLRVYESNNDLRKMSRSIEFVVFVYDGGNLTVTSTFCGTKFDEPSKSYEKGLEIHDQIYLQTKTWVLFSIPWIEKNKDNLAALVGRETWNPYVSKVAKWIGGKTFQYYKKDNFLPSMTFDSSEAIWVADYGRNQDASHFLVNSEGGMSLDYKIFTKPIPANTQVQFGLPFNFPMSFRDIVNESGNPAQLVMWEYQPGFQKKDNRDPYHIITDSDTLYPWRGYVVKASVPFNLKFPLRDVHRTHLSPSKKIAGGKGYKVSLYAGDDYVKTRLVVGKHSQSFFAGAAPFAPGQKHSITVKSLAAHNQLQDFSYAIEPLYGKPKAGIWPIHNSGTSENLSIKLFQTDGLPDSMKVFLVGLKDRKLMELSKSRPEVPVSGKALSSGEYALVVGSQSDAYNLSTGFSFDFNIFPNPFSHSFSLKFRVPYHLAITGPTRYDIRIFDIKGKIIHQASGSYNKAGSQFRYMWNGRDVNDKSVGAGNYILDFSIFVNGRRQMHKRHKIVKLR